MLAHWYFNSNTNLDSEMKDIKAKIRKEQLNQKAQDRQQLKKFLNIQGPCIDQTQFIDLAFENENDKIEIFYGAKGHAKTTNLALLKVFLELRYEPRSFLFKTNNDHLELFKRQPYFKSLSKSKKERLLQKCGQYAVAFLSFKDFKGKSYEKDFLKGIITHKVFQSIKDYLPPLSYIMAQSKTHCSRDQYERMKEDGRFFDEFNVFNKRDFSVQSMQTILNLRVKLIELLEKYSQKKAFILVDDFDALEQCLLESNLQEDDEFLKFIFKLVLEPSQGIEKVIVMSGYSSQIKQFSDNIENRIDYQSFSNLTDQQLDDYVKQLAAEMVLQYLSSIGSQEPTIVSLKAFCELWFRGPIQAQVLQSSLNLLRQQISERTTSSIQSNLASNKPQSNDSAQEEEFKKQEK